jgi:hypothetical protein
MNPIYKQKVKVEIDKMLEVGVIEHVEKSKWSIPMIFQEKKQWGDRDLCMLEEVE